MREFRPVLAQCSPRSSSANFVARPSQSPTDTTRCVVELSLETRRVKRFTVQLQASPRQVHNGGVGFEALGIRCEEVNSLINQRIPSASRSSDRR